MCVQEERLAKRVGGGGRREGRSRVECFELCCVEKWGGGRLSGHRGAPASPNMGTMTFKPFFEARLLATAPRLCPASDAHTAVTAVGAISTKVSGLGLVALSELTLAPSRAKTRAVASPMPELHVASRTGAGQWAIAGQ